MSTALAPDPTKVPSDPIDNPSNPDRAAQPKDPPGQPSRQPPEKNPEAPVEPPRDAPQPAATADTKYDLKLPENSALDASAIERTAAIARTLGLSNEHAQQALEFVNQETASRIQAVMDAHKPGGAEWTKQVDGWKRDTLADPALGKTPEERQAAITQGRGVIQKFAEAHPEYAVEFRGFLNESGLGDHPAVARLFAWLGKAMGSPTTLVTGDPAAKKPATPEQAMYPNMFNEDGSPKTA